MTILAHATCVALRLRGRAWRAVLLRGPSGAGKSDLALRLIEAGGRIMGGGRTADGQPALAEAGVPFALARI